jgi:hypothetical protein
MSKFPITYLGDAATAAAFASAGIEARAPAPGEEHAEFERARAESKVVLLGTSVAASLSPHALENSLVSLAPLVAVIHDAEGRAAVPDPAARVRRQLGIDE